jgi:hypothetical protein
MLMKFEGTLDEITQEYRIYFHYGVIGPKRVIQALLKVNEGVPITKNGVTVTSTSTVPIRESVSRCKVDEPFIKEIGRRRALRRLLSVYPRPFRTAAWDAYWSRLKEPINYQTLLMKYINLVGEMEGVDFINQASPSTFTADEITELKRCSSSIPLSTQGASAG